jgi:hypothetical protein
LCVVLELFDMRFVFAVLELRLCNLLCPGMHKLRPSVHKLRVAL